MNVNQPADAVPLLSPRRHAFFFDVDGTLAALQPQPDEVFIPPAVLHCLAQLSEASQQALALISGRPVQQLDALAAPLRLPLAGVHGAERRDARDRLHRFTLPAETAVPLADRLQQAMAEMPGVQLEAKGMAFALHYRNAPRFADALIALAEEQVARFPQLALQPGKCVIELKPKECNKGIALRAFMQEPPFAGRIPVFVGDDLTDEAGFEVVNALGGYAIKVGDGQTQAAFRLADVAAVYAWLELLILQ